MNCEQQKDQKEQHRRNSNGPRSRGRYLVLVSNFGSRGLFQVYRSIYVAFPAFFLHPSYRNYVNYMNL